MSRQCLNWIVNIGWVSLLFLFAYYIGAFSPTLSLASSEREVIERVSICLDDPIAQLDPAIHRSRNTQIVLKNILDSLTTVDGHMDVVPQLAQSWKMIDGTHWEFKLKKGVTFHDGTTLTANDVQFSLNRIILDNGLGGKNSPRKSLLGPVTGVEIVDDYMVLITTLKPWRLLPMMLSLQEIVPKEYMLRVGSHGFQAHPVGTGPYRFVSLENDKKIILQRYKNYHGASQPPCPTESARPEFIEFNYIASKPLQVQLLKRGECSIITRVPPSTLPLLRKTPGIKIQSAPANRSYYADINCTKPPFNNQRIRLALNYGVNIRRFVEKVLLGEGSQLPTVMLPQSSYYNQALLPYRYDVEKARELLSEVGGLQGATVQIYSQKESLAFANHIASDLIRLGVSAKVTSVMKRRPERIGEDSPWDMFVGSWGNSTLDPVGIIIPKFKTDGRGNYSGYSNLNVDNLITEAEKEQDVEKRKQLYSEIQRIIYEDVPMIFGYGGRMYYGVSNNVKNFTPTGSGMINMHDICVQGGIR